MQAGKGQHYSSTSEFIILVFNCQEIDIYDNLSMAVDHKYQYFYRQHLVYFKVLASAALP